MRMLPSRVTYLSFLHLSRFSSLLGTKGKRQKKRNGLGEVRELFGETCHRVLKKSCSSTKDGTMANSSGRDRGNY